MMTDPRMSDRVPLDLKAIRERVGIAAPWPGEWCQHYAEDVPALIEEITYLRDENERAAVLLNAWTTDADLGEDIDNATRRWLNRAVTEPNTAVSDRVPLDLPTDVVQEPGEPKEGPITDEDIDELMEVTGRGSPPKNDAARELYYALQEAKTERDEARVQREEYGRENEDLREWLANAEESNRMMEDRLQRLIQGNAALRNELDECRDRGMALVAELRSRGWTGEVEDL